MTATREALTLPMLFLTVVVAGSVRIGMPLAFVPPSLFALVLAMLVVGCLVQSGTLNPAVLMNSDRSALENLNGCVVLLTLFAASAQTLAVVLPQRGVPAVLMGTLMCALLIQALAIGAPRAQLLRGLFVSLGIAFILKFIVLDALAAPAATLTARVVQLLFEGVTLGAMGQPPLHPATGYVAFFTITLYLFGIVLLPRRGTQPWVDRDLLADRSADSLQRR